METTIKRTNKATLIAAALIITGATAIFGTYAADEQPAPDDQNRRPTIHQELTDEQKAALEEAKELFQAGDKEGAMEILKEAGVKPPKHHKNQGQFMKNLTDEQKEVWKEAKKLMKDGDMEGAKAILEEAGIKPPKKQGPRPEFLENLTEEQKAALEEAKELFQAGDKEGGMAILEEAGIKLPKKPGQRRCPGPEANETE